MEAAHKAAEQSPGLSCVMLLNYDPAEGSSVGLSSPDLEFRSF